MVHLVGKYLKIKRWFRTLQKKNPLTLSNKQKMTSIALNCMILGDSPDLVFVVRIDPAKRIDELKCVIKERRSDVFGASPAVNMVLWKVEIALNASN